MKKIILLFIIITLTQISLSYTLKIGVYENPPLMYAEDGKIKGILPEIMNYIAKKEKFTPQYVYLNFSDALDYLENDLIDMVLGAGYTKERDKIFEYNSVPLYDTYGKIFTNKHTKIQNFIDLKHKKIGVIKDDIFYTGEKGLKNINEMLDLDINFIEFNTHEEMCKSLSKNEIDAGLLNYYSGITLYKKYNLVETPISFYIINAYIIYHKKSLKDIIQKIDIELSELKANKNSIYYTVTNKYIFNFKFPTWIKLFVFFSLIILISLSFIILLMRNIIQKRTIELKKQIEITKSKNEELRFLLDSLEAYTRELQFTKEKLEKSETLLKAIIENSQDGILFVDKKLNIILANSVFKKWTKRDFKKELKEGDNLKDVFKGENLFFKEIEIAIKEKRKFFVEKEIKRFDGSKYWVSNSYYPIFQSKEIQGIALISRDITKSKKNELVLQKMAHFDSLTNVYNRHAGFQLLNEIISLSKRNGIPVTIGFIDVDNLKNINDTYGHFEGDKSLKIIANTIKKHIRESDIVARYGGDEFFIGLYNCRLENARRLEKNIAKELKKLSEKNKINYSVSFGFIEYNHSETLDSIISKADEIMYKNKRKKKKL
ncbi:PAS domain S-box-containing protein/diguanylate cyclase (GGDEF) domain-containing protein [Marinitoga hydrogenitolerans DSM 16785]|uniref:PAS domain S-box-containing protein/diguanylate cyclase (GGDEF) domain-containing protein n=1 Tax=Marinitoga hydrogenitolerans (strain DSM 16785 / JCM 12826 / AT1271) TaxID=1122195 RepID=A0A1M4VBR8_MARH1|nr:diguanylate cyclase [Marinitoga hydrogenitolerans]SHE66320.1 PAS domain S-box-containing protein/diguanylate cyclase (GGDEF) domain-containing protein [Marinitoga hydrogenitolerans DSM 16785]